MSGRMGWGGGSGPAALKPEVVGPLALWDSKNRTCTSAPAEGEGVAGLPRGEGGGRGVRAEANALSSLHRSLDGSRLRGRGAARAGGDM